ncbi:hypothetical protein K492DRAFT_208334 [Lichtheimia hyalospora FSU 10163]|nr:hypothetical protein K492DRAFT_208334 [Lichtheimia hyalospora FSU 10163]
MRPLSTFSEISYICSTCQQQSALVYMRGSYLVSCARALLFFYGFLPWFHLGNRLSTTMTRQCESTLQLKQVSNTCKQPRDTIRTRVWSIIAYKRMSFCCSLLLSTAIVLNLFPVMPATYDRHCQVPKASQHEEKYGQYKIG